MNTEDINKMIDERFQQLIKEYNQNSFTDRRIVDTPTDAFQVVNRKYVTLNGATGNRPASSVLGQFYYDTTIDRPVWWNGSAWKKADGTSA